ncbi:MAG: serine/threonine-protein kinase [Gemmatimonadota bacterium]|nr:serine/threonine-protein kinase [Gemmatimonadota bacterium]MDH3422632.1 serine/threonine-protein kinase [Gemmatimonadota bacterium]
MSAPRWEEVERLFAAALDHPEADRERFVRASAMDEASADEVVALLAAHVRQGLFDPLTELPADPHRLRPGARLGAWEVIGELGRGGMGIVFQVRRADGQFEQKAALKILPSVSPGPGSETRFIAERQILARLAHPYIARLLDGGISADGRPWFVMEQVDGDPLDRYCDARRLSLVERLRLFTRLCEAIQYAHQNLIVHRDLKPGNILVTPAGEPRLLDFGIATVLDEARAGDGSATQIGTRVLTPEFASPEQFRGEAVTTASDVYQLGLLLWRLLVGGSPARRHGGSGGGGDQSLPMSTDYLRPSRIVLEGDDTADVAAARATTPPALARMLRGDLESILLKALRPEPDQRYSSAGHLADDIERYLAGRPVRARPDTWRYVSGKFVRRHALAVSATGGAFLLVIGLALGMRRQAIETAVERDRAEQVIDLLVGLFTSADPLRTPDDSVTVRDVLDRGAVRIRSGLADQPAVQATLMHAIGDVYASLGASDQAIDLLEDALATGVRALGPEHPDVALTERRLAMAHAQASNFVRADSLLRSAEKRLASRPPTSLSERAMAFNDIGYAWQVLGQRERAEPLLENALETWALVPDRGASGAGTYTNLGWLRSAAADYDSAEVLFRKGLAIREAELGPQHQLVAANLEALVHVLSRTNRLQEADSAVTAAIAIRERVYPPDHQAILGLRVQRAGILRRAGRPAEAETLLREVLDAQRRTLGDTHFVLAATHNDLSIALRDQGRDAEAEPHLRTAWDGYVRAFGEGHVNPAVIEGSLARLLYQTGSPTEAEARYGHAVPILRAAFPADRRFMVDLVDLGSLRCNAPDPSEAYAILREGVELLAAGSGQSTDQHLHALTAMGLCQERHGLYDAAARTAAIAISASANRDDSEPHRALAIALRDRTSGR